MRKIIGFALIYLVFSVPAVCEYIWPDPFHEGGGYSMSICLNSLLTLGIGVRLVVDKDFWDDIFDM